LKKLSNQQYPPSTAQKASGSFIAKPIDNVNHKADFDWLVSAAMSPHQTALKPANQGKITQKAKRS
jgi:hypothetical protein